MSFASIRSTRATPLVEINITPLVDVLLTVLIIFMIAAPVVTKKIVLPLSGSDSEATEARVLGVSIDEFGQLRLDDRAVSLRELDTEVGLAGAQARVRMELRPRAQTPYDDVAKVLALARRHEVSDLRVESAPAR
ncbi:MAG: biopolymer transporter ExbD [Xanthomonadales bacterium]|nr:biopolymer transporter ExbD [Xanthomonadales bacterium]